MSLKNIIITASINSIATQSYGQKTYIASTDEQSFPIEEITGSYAGAWPSFIPGTNGSASYTVDLIVNITQSWPDSNITPLGLVSFTHDTMEEFINGEFSGSEYVVTDGNLTDDYCQQFLTVSTQPVAYNIFPYVTEFNINSQTITYDSFPEFFHRYTVPGPGQILIYVYQTTDTSLSPTIYYTRTINYAKVARIDQLGNDNTFSLQALTSLRWTDFPPDIGEIALTVTNITEYQDYYLYEVTSDIFSSTSSIFIDDDNVLDYTLNTTSSYTGSLNVGYNYLTSSWVTITDTSNGFNTSSGHYVFPLTPNCDIQFTASIDITITTSSSFSIAINAYDPIYPHTVSNVVGSIPSPLISSTNTFILTNNSITHSIIISGSSPSPIQTYQYEINAWIEGTGDAYINNIINTSIFSTIDNQPNSLPFPQYLPTASYGGIGQDTEWTSIVQDGTYSPSPTYTDPSYGWNSYQFIESWNTGTPTEANGAVLIPEPFTNPTLGQILSLKIDGANRPWDITGNTTYLFKVVIPSPFSSSGNTNVVYGPPLFNLTCSLNDINDIENIAGFIGYIPANTPGSFYFPFTPTNGQQTLHIIAPSGSSTWNAATQYDDGYFAMVSETSIISQNTASIHGLSFNITQSQPPQSSTSSFILEPYLPANFNYTDCDVLMNNASQNDISNVVQEVLYDAGSVIPSNIEQIISGTAQRAEVNDYLYTAAANTLPRYSGVRTTSPGFNLSPSLNGFTTTQLSNLGSNDIVGVGQPNVENTTTYFAYFSSLKSNNPIFKGTTSPIIKYLIGEDGATYSPSTDEASYYNLVNSFPRDSKASCNLLYETSPIFNSTQSIILSGESYTPILYNIESANATTAVFTGSIGFNNLQGVTSTAITPPSYSLYVQKLGSNQTLNSLPTNSFYDSFTVSYDPENNWNGSTFSSNIYQPNYLFDSVIPVSVKVTVGLSGFRVTGPSARVRARIWTYDGTSTEVSQATSNAWPQGNWGSGVGSIINHSFTFTPNPNDRLYVTLELIGGTPGSDRIQNAYLKIETLGLSIPSVDGPFWYTGSANSTTITSSLGLGAVLQGNYQQIDIENSGFDPIELPCQIQVGDEIRFEYDEANTYRIISVDPTGSGAGIQTILTLDRPVPTIPTLDINHFTVRRKIKDAITGISFNAGLLTTVQDGFLLPEYPSKTIQNNISNIIQDLINKSVI